MCQTDLAGNVGPAATLVFTLDRVTASNTNHRRPGPGHQAIPTDKSTSNPALRLAGVESSDQVEYSFSGGGWSTTYTPGGDGTKSVQVRQTDLAGNVGPASAAFALFTLDTVGGGRGRIFGPQTPEGSRRPTQSPLGRPCGSAASHEKFAMVHATSTAAGGRRLTRRAPGEQRRSRSVKPTWLETSVRRPRWSLRIDTTPPAGSFGSRAWTRARTAALQGAT